MNRPWREIDQDNTCVWQTDRKRIHTKLKYISSESSKSKGAKNAITLSDNPISKQKNKADDTDGSSSNVSSLEAFPLVPIYIHCIYLRTATPRLKQTNIRDG